MVKSKSKAVLPTTILDTIKSNMWIPISIVAILVLASIIVVVVVTTRKNSSDDALSLDRQKSITNCYEDVFRVIHVPATKAEISGIPVGTRILLVAEPRAAQNGIYVVKSKEGDIERASDMNNNSHIRSGMNVFSTEEKEVYILGVITSGTGIKNEEVGYKGVSIPMIFTSYSEQILGPRSSRPPNSILSSDDNGNITWIPSRPVTTNYVISRENLTVVTVRKTDKDLDTIYIVGDNNIYWYIKVAWNISKVVEEFPTNAKTKDIDISYQFRDENSIQITMSSESVKTVSNVSMVVE